MTKKEYMKPTMKVAKVQQSQLICGSLRSVKFSGLDNDNDLQYSNESGNQGLAW